MARVEITMPQLGESVTEGTITKWLKEVGEEIAEDELLFEVSTDKVDSEVPSPRPGYLAEIIVPEGETVEVGSVLCFLTDTKADTGKTGTQKGTPTATVAETTTLNGSSPGKSSGLPQPLTTPSSPPVLPTQPTSVPDGGKPVFADISAQSSKEKHPSMLLSPVVRRLLNENTLRPEQIQGTGPGGRITRGDVLAVIEQGTITLERTTPQVETHRAAATVQAAPTPVLPPAPSHSAGLTEFSGRSHTVPFSNIRRRTAEHMVMSVKTSAHVTISMEIDFEKVAQVRLAARSEWKAEENFSLTYLPFVARALCDTIREFPHVNAQVDGNALLVHHYVNLGIAVDLDFNGLVVPVIRNAETKRLRAIAREISDLARRARNKQLSPDEIMHGTFTMTNPGPYGTFLSSAIINQPQVAILTTDGVKKQAVVLETEMGDTIAIRHRGSVSLTFDHRAFDGAYAAAFLHKLKETIETRDWETELA